MSVNKAIIVGRLGKDAEDIKGKGVRLTVATSERWKDKDGNQQERTEWHNVTAWGTEKQVAYWVDAFKKGKNVYVEGQIRTEEYEKDGSKRYSTGIHVQGPSSKLEVLDGGSSSSEGSSQSSNRSNSSSKPASKPEAQSSKKPEAQPAQQDYAQDQGGFDDNFDDDIPF